MSFFEFVTPESGDLPVLVEVPHAGLAIPEVVRHELEAPRDAILRDADIYVDHLVAETPARGASLLVSKVSRYVVDLNRAPDDVDAGSVPEFPLARSSQPRGVIWRMTTDGRPVLRRPLTRSELEARLDRFHRPYHRTLQGELDRLRDRHGFAILLAAHSMPSVGRLSPIDPGIRRADIVPGSRGGTTADRRVVALVEEHFRDSGLSVRHDDPYRGGYATAHYGRPERGCHAIQIEVNRALYVDERTAEPLESGMASLRALFADLVTKLGALALA